MPAENKTTSTICLADVFSRLFLTAASPGMLTFKPFLPSEPLFDELSYFKSCFFSISLIFSFIYLEKYCFIYCNKIISGR